MEENEIVDETNGIVKENQVLLNQLLGREPEPEPVIGDFKDGGVVFWLDPLDNSKGLICAIEDQESFRVMGWSNNRNWIKTRAIGVEIGTGLENTNKIIEIQGEPTAADYVAWVSRDYRGGGFDDWFLPSQDELNEMFVSRNEINATSVTNGGTALVHWERDIINANGYWCSTEYNEIEGSEFYNESKNEYYKKSKSWIQSMLTGVKKYYGKGNLGFHARPIRKF